jgi:hypothetical protein
MSVIDFSCDFITTATRLTRMDAAAVYWGWGRSHTFSLLYKHTYVEAGRSVVRTRVFSKSGEVAVVTCESPPSMTKTRVHRT